MERQELFKLLRQALDCKERTIETRLKELIDAGTVISDGTENYSLDKRFENRKISYYLKHIENQ